MQEEGERKKCKDSFSYPLQQEVKNVVVKMNFHS